MMRALFLLFGLALGASQAAWDPVPAVDLARLRPADFRDDQLDLPYYMAHFRRLAESVVEQGPDRGFIHIPVWRSVSGNQPYNARIMESILSLAYWEFAHQLMDSRRPQVFTYIRRPLYYAAFNSGPQLARQQRYGLGLLWSEKTGAVLQSQTGSATAAWGTMAEGAEAP